MNSATAPAPAMIGSKTYHAVEEIIKTEITSLNVTIELYKKMVVLIGHIQKYLSDVGNKEFSKKFERLHLEYSSLIKVYEEIYRLVGDSPQEFMTALRVPHTDLLIALKDRPTKEVITEMRKQLCLEDHQVVRLNYQSDEEYHSYLLTCALLNFLTSSQFATLCTLRETGLREYTRLINFMKDITDVLPQDFKDKVGRGYTFEDMSSNAAGLFQRICKYEALGLALINTFPSEWKEHGTLHPLYNVAQELFALGQACAELCNYTARFAENVGVFDSVFYDVCGDYIKKYGTLKLKVEANIIDLQKTIADLENKIAEKSGNNSKNTKLLEKSQALLAEEKQYWNELVSDIDYYGKSKARVIAGNLIDLEESQRRVTDVIKRLLAQRIYYYKEQLKKPVQEITTDTHKPYQANSNLDFKGSPISTPVSPKAEVPPASVFSRALSYASFSKKKKQKKVELIRNVAAENDGRGASLAATSNSSNQTDLTSKKQDPQQPEGNNNDFPVIRRSRPLPPNPLQRSPGSGSHSSPMKRSRPLPIPPGPKAVTSSSPSGGVESPKSPKSESLVFDRVLVNTEKEKEKEKEQEDISPPEIESQIFFQTETEDETKFLKTESVYHRLSSQYLQLCKEFDEMKNSPVVQVRASQVRDSYFNERNYDPNRNRAHSAPELRKNVKKEEEGSKRRPNRELPPLPPKPRGK